MNEYVFLIEYLNEYLFYSYSFTTIAFSDTATLFMLTVLLDGKRNSVPYQWTFT